MPPFVQELVRTIWQIALCQRPASAKRQSLAVYCSPGLDLLLAEIASPHRFELGSVTKMEQNIHSCGDFGNWCYRCSPLPTSLVEPASHTNLTFERSAIHVARRQGSPRNLHCVQTLR